MSGCLWALQCEGRTLSLSPGRQHSENGTMPPTGRSSRRIAARVLAVLATVGWGWVFFGLQDFLTPLVEGQDFAVHYLMETGWGLTFLVLTAVPLAVLVVRPGTSVALLQVTAVGMSLLLGAALAASPRHLLPAIAALLTAALLALLGGAKPPARLDRPAW